MAVLVGPGVRYPRTCGKLLLLAVVVVAALPINRESVLNRPWLAGRVPRLLCTTACVRGNWLGRVDALAPVDGALLLELSRRPGTCRRGVPCSVGLPCLRRLTWLAPSGRSISAGVSGGVAPVRRNDSVRVCPGTSFFVLRGEGEESDEAVVLGVGGTIGINGREWRELECPVDPMCVEEPSTDRLLGCAIGVGGAARSGGACRLR